jgi:hypothetical protein
MTFVTYQVNAIALGSFKPMEVLPNNQANISIMRPELLSAFQEAESEVRINRVGDVQLKTTKQTGLTYLIFSACTQVLIQKQTY